MNGWLESLCGILLRDPHWLWLAPLVPVAWWLRKRRGRAALLFAPAPLIADQARDPAIQPELQRLPRSWGQRLLPLPDALMAVALLLLVVALARPVRRDPLPQQVEGIDILLCIDGSSSMAERDLDPADTRLELVRAAAARFIAARPHDRIGLLRFARFPDLVCPLTLDHRALLELLADVELVAKNDAEDRTGIGIAVARAAMLLRGSTAPSRVVIVLSDGVENVAGEDTPDEIGPLRAGQLCEQLGVRVHAIAVAPPAAPVAARPIDTDQLRRLAESTGGLFLTAHDGGALSAVYAAIDELETAPLAEPRFRLEDRCAPLLFAALGALLIARLLQCTALEVLP